MHSIRNVQEALQDELRAHDAWQGITLDPQLSTELQKVLGAREIRQKLLVTGWKVDDTSPQALAQRIKADSEACRELITRNGIRLE